MNYLKKYITFFTFVNTFFTFCVVSTLIKYFCFVFVFPEFIDIKIEYEWIVSEHHLFEI